MSRIHVELPRREQLVTNRQLRGALYGLSIKQHHICEYGFATSTNLSILLTVP